MAIKISGTTVINDDSNIVNVGIVTIGTGGTDGQLNVGTGVTIDGAGNAYFDGYITVNGGINYLTGITSIQPQGTYLTDNDIYSSWDGVLTLFFDSPVEVSAGSTLTIDLRRDSIGGDIIATAGVSSISYPGGDFSILEVALGGITTAPFSGIATYYPIIPKGIIQFTVSGLDYAGNYSGDPQQNEFTFEFKGTPLGTAYEGGYAICASGGTVWVVAPSSSQVTRCFGQVGDSNTCAQQVSGCTGWFIPNCSIMQNPGYLCRTYWDSYESNTYWTSSHVDFSYVTYLVDFSTGSLAGGQRTLAYRARSFRTVSY